MENAHVEKPRSTRFLKASLIVVVCAADVVAGLVFRKRQERQSYRNRMEARLAKFRSPLFLERQAARNQFGLEASPEHEKRLNEYDNPLQAAELFRAQRVAPQNHKPGTGPIPYAKYVAAFSRISRMPQFSTAMGRSLPSRAQMAALGQLSFSVSSLVQ